MTCTSLLCTGMAWKSRLFLYKHRLLSLVLEKNEAFLTPSPSFPHTTQQNTTYWPKPRVEPFQELFSSLLFHRLSCLPGPADRAAGLLEPAVVAEHRSVRAGGDVEALTPMRILWWWSLQLVVVVVVVLVLAVFVLPSLLASCSSFVFLFLLFLLLVGLVAWGVSC